MLNQRRRFLKQAVAWLAGLVAEPVVASRVAEHFAAGDFETRFNALFASRIIIDTDLIRLDLPDTAENGAVVPLGIVSQLESVETLYVFVEKNPTPLVAEFELSPWVMAQITARIKMAESCRVVVIAQTPQQLFRCSRWVNVVHGGCGAG